MGHPAAQCIRCHKIGSTGGVLGPDLSKIASRLTSKKILESLINPQAELAEGYGLLVATLKDGTTISGSIIKSTRKVMPCSPPKERNLRLTDPVLQRRFLLPPCLRPEPFSRRPKFGISSPICPPSSKDKPLPSIPIKRKPSK